MPRPPARIFHEGPLGTGAVLRLSAEESRHVRSRRLRDGSPVDVFDGAGATARGRLTGMAEGAPAVVVDAVDTGRPSGREIVLVMSAIRPDRLAWALEKATELGVSRIVIARSARAQGGRIAAARAGRERWARIVREAAKQCGRARLPAVDGPVAETEILGAELAGAGDRIILDPSGEPFPERLPGARVVLWVGPEGGFAPSEVRAAALRGWRSVRLPGATLRSETAALVAAALAASAIDRCEGRADNSATEPSERGRHGV